MTPQNLQISVLYFALKSESTLFFFKVEELAVNKSLSSEELVSFDWLLILSDKPLYSSGNLLNVFEASLSFIKMSLLEFPILTVLSKGINYNNYMNTCLFFLID